MLDIAVATGFLDAVQLYGMLISSYRLLGVGWDDWDTEAEHVECLLQDWRRGVLDYLRVLEGGVKDKHVIDYNYVVRLVRNYDCDNECGSDTRQESHYRALREF